MSPRARRAAHDGDPPAPSTRVTEARLQELESYASHDDLHRGPGAGDEVRELVAEIRRLRALLLGVSRGHLPSDCHWCLETWRQRSDTRSVVEMQSGATAGGCPYAEVEAEVQAIRAERR